MRMAVMTLAAAVLGLLVNYVSGEATTQPKAGPALAYTMKDIDGQDLDLGKYQGQVVLVVNVASKCGLTPQYADLQKLYDKYKDQGFVILGFPANNFATQEPGTNAQIKEFCSTKYAVTFPMFAKISVKGDDIAALYKYLTGLTTAPQPAGEITWNFEKFLIGREGTVVARFAPKTVPSDEAITKALETELAKAKP